MSSPPGRRLVQTLQLKTRLRWQAACFLAVMAALAAGLLGLRSRPGAGRAVSAIEVLGGTVETDTQQPGRTVGTADLHGCRVDDDWLVCLQDLPDLRQLDLSGTRVTDAGMAHLASLHQLRGLNLNMTQVGDAGLRSLAGLSELRELGLAACRVTDAGLDALQSVPRLERVNLHGTHVTEQGLRRLTASRPGLDVQR
jgi:hypothetical protein